MYGVYKRLRWQTMLLSRLFNALRSPILAWKRFLAIVMLISPTTSQQLRNRNYKIKIEAFFVIVPDYTLFQHTTANPYCSLTCTVVDLYRGIVHDRCIPVDNRASSSRRPPSRGSIRTRHWPQNTPRYHCKSRPSQGNLVEEKANKLWKVMWYWPLERVKSFIIHSLYSLWRVTSGLGEPCPLPCAGFQWLHSQSLGAGQW